MSGKFSTRALVEAGVAVALAAVLDTVKVFSMPQGGSITAGSMIPIFIIALRHGTGVGMTAGAVFGVVQMILSGMEWVIHPVQGALDYPIAFGLLGLAGLPWNRWLSIGLGVLLRYAAHVISGVVFFAEFAEGQNVWVYSLVYNGSYYLPDLAVSGVLVALLLAHPAIKARVQPTARGAA